MKYTILINQAAAIANFGDKLDIIDLMIFDYIHGFLTECENMVDQNGIWFWISHKKIMEDMPLLGIKTKRPLLIRINKLIDCGILERHPNSKDLARSYYKQGKNFKCLVFQRHKDNCVPEAPPTIKEDIAPTILKSEDYIIKDNYISIEGCDNLKITEDEYGRLVSDYDESLAEEFCRELATYKRNNRKKYVHDYGAIQSWVIKKVLGVKVNRDVYKFYEKEIRNNNEGRYIDQYKRYCEMLKGQNIQSVKMYYILAVPAQLSYAGFQDIFIKYKKSGKGLLVTIKELNNSKSYLSKSSDIYTLLEKELNRKNYAKK